MRMGRRKEDFKVPEGDVEERGVRLWVARKRDFTVVVMAGMEMEIVVEVRENSDCWQYEGGGQYGGAKSRCGNQRSCNGSMCRGQC